MMESPATASRYIDQNSKKRVFLGGSSSSSSAAREDLEVFDVPPVPSTVISAKISSSKEKEVNHEILDMSAMEEDSDDVAYGGVPKTSSKGKEPLQYSSVGDGGLENDDIMSSAGGSHDSPGEDYSISSLSDGEDEWADSYHDEMLFDEYAKWESKFDHMDIPTGVEVRFPWIPGNSSTPSSVEPQPAAENSSSGLNSSESPMDHVHKNQPNTLSSSSTDHLASGKPSEHNTSLHPQGSKALSYLKPEKQSLQGNKRNFRSMNSLDSSHSNHSPSGAMSNNGGGYLASDFPSWKDPSYAKWDSEFDGFLSHGAFQPATGHAKKQGSASSVATTTEPASSEPRKVEEILQNYASFKRFETVEDCSDHRYHSHGSSSKQPPKNWAKRIQEEWRVLEKDLPEKIFVRAYEARIDLLRAVIIGAEGTPYHNGLFFFDLHFPSAYPTVPPLVYYHSGGLRINPNLYNCGKVCLSLLNTWSGSQKENWIPGESTILQVLVSIQGLILNAEPFFNEPGYADMKGSDGGEMRSIDYNESTFMHSLQTMVYKIRNPPKYFEDFVVGHFIKVGRDILMACKAYLDGAQVGSVVKGAVQEVKEVQRGKSSQRFKDNLVGFLSIVVPTFLQIGAKDCEEFIGLALRGNGIDGITRADPPNGSTKLYE